jgi:hypothetical protein
MNGSLFTLSRDELSLLQDACTRHTMGLTEADITVQTCWDADRLDLPRVQKFPVPERLCTKPARDVHFIELTSQRSIANHLTAFALELKITCLIQVPQATALTTRSHRNKVHK